MFRLKVLYSLFGPYRKSVIAGPSLPKESKVAGRILQLLSFNSLMMWSPGVPGRLGPLNFLFSAASWCRKTLSVISERDTSSSAVERLFVPINVVSMAILVVLVCSLSLRYRRISAGLLRGWEGVSPTGSKDMWFSVGMSFVIVAVFRIIVAKLSRISLCAAVLLWHAII